jgi:Beta-galactosidase
MHPQARTACLSTLLSSFLGFVQLLAQDSSSTGVSMGARANAVVSHFIISGRSQPVVIRGLGPSLAAYGANGTLADPVLELRDSNGALLARNDNWRDTQAQRFETGGVDAAFRPPNELESAIAITLDPGTYRVVVLGKNAATGVAMVEVYALPRWDSAAGARELTHSVEQMLMANANNSGAESVRSVGQGASGVSGNQPNSAPAGVTGKNAAALRTLSGEDAAQPAPISVAPASLSAAASTTHLAASGAVQIHKVICLNATARIPSSSPTPSPTPTATPSPSITPTPTPSPTVNPTPTATPSATPTPTSSPTPSPTPTSTPTPQSAPVGVFSLLDPGARIDSRVLSNPYVKGVSLRYEWRDLNPADGVYDWTYLDGQISAAGAAGKKVVLRLVDGGLRIPGWVLDGASTTFSFQASPVFQPGMTITLPVFWDTYYLAKKKAMISALGARYSGNPAVVMIGFGINNAETDEWEIPHNAKADAPFTNSEVQRWYNAGYTPAKVIAAAGDLIDTAMAAFPNQTLAIPIDSNGFVIDSPSKPDYESRSIISNARTKWAANRLVAERHDLSTTIPAQVPAAPSVWKTLYDSQPAVGGQMLSAAYADTSYLDNGGVTADATATLRRSVDLGASYGMKYVEFYQTDVINLPGAVSYAQSVLDPGATPAPTPTPIPTATPKVPHGVFDLTGAGAGVDPAALANTSVDGISLRQRWADLEPTDGVYNWAYFDSQIAQAQTARKQVLLRVATSVDNMPAWLMPAVRNAGGSTFTFTDSAGQHTIPVFWDATLLAKKNAMITALGARYANNPAVKIVAASFANTSSEDWNVPHGATIDPGYTTSELTRWRNAGYTTQKMITAGNSVIDTTMRAFPNQVVLLAVNSNGNALDYPNDDNYVSETVVANARATWGETRLVVGRNSICTSTAPPPPASATSLALWYNSRDAAAAQTLWNAYGDTSYRLNGGKACAPATALQQSVDIAVSYGIEFIELYETDVINLPGVIAYAHSHL